MVVKVQQSAASCRAPLGYNERKVAMGEADIIGFSHIDRPTPACIYGTFDRYEANPAISARTGNLAFHMTVNPSRDERMDDSTALQFVSELMDRIGYGEQPWVVYRHDDTGRTHYHIVSVRVDANGKVISDSFQRRQIQTVMNELGPRYGFRVGNGEGVDPERRLSRNADRRRVASIVSSCFNHSSSELHFQRMLERKEIGLRIFRTQEGRIYGALFDDRKTGNTFKCSELKGISVGMMRDALASGKWAEPGEAVVQGHQQTHGNVGEESEGNIVADIIRKNPRDEKSKERDIRKKKRKGIHL